MMLTTRIGLVVFAIVAAFMVPAAINAGGPPPPATPWPYAPQPYRCFQLGQDDKGRVYLNGRKIRLAPGQVVVSCSVDAPPTP